MHPATVTRPGVRGRLIVTRRDPQTTLYRAIGFLDQLADGYEFAYLASAITTVGFVPLVGFSDVTRRYRRVQLFPSFAERVISAGRPDRPSYLASLQLSSDADAWEILTATGGYREGDSIELISLPTYHPGSGRTEARFLAHGARYIDPAASLQLSRLRPGQRLQLRPDVSNQINPKAIRIVDGFHHFGYVPDPLLDYVAAVRGGGEAALTVVTANPPDTHPHLRLLLHLEGTIHGPDPFEAPQWRTIA
jgi:hypothetical protein